MNEHDIEEQLCSHISNFLLELGRGFSFVGRQYHLQVNNDDFFIDLLFYHIKLRCYVVVELKASKFKPDYAGQLNFYISAVDDMLKSENDNPTIGILLCKRKNGVVAEYALRGMTHPIGVADVAYAIGLSSPKYFTKCFKEAFGLTPSDYQTQSFNEIAL